MQLTTDRLIIIPTSISDAAFLKKLVNTPDWLVYIGDRNVRTKEEAEAYALKAVNAYNPALGIGQYIMRLRSDGQPIGVTGIYKREGLEHADIGFALLPEFYGKGFALEGTHALMQHVIATTSIKRIEAITIEANVPSQKLLKKLGLSFEKITYLPDDLEPLMLFSIDL